MTRGEGLRLHWFLPTSGDSRGLVGAGQGVPHEVRSDLSETVRDGFRPPTIDYLADVARTAEKLGFEGVLTPTGTFCEDAWLTTAALLREASTLKFLVAFRPGVINPVLAAQMAAAYQRISDGRLMLNVVTGGEPKEQARFGDTAPKAERYARTEEFLAVVRGTWAEPPFSYDGRFYSADGALVSGGIDPQPDIYFGGSSGPAGPVAAKHADVYLTWGEPPEQVAEKIAWMRGLAAAEGRTLRFGLRVHTLSRDTSEAAWAHAQWLLDGLEPSTIAAAQAAMRQSESTGQQRMTALHGGSSYASARELEIHPGLWSGVGLVRGGAGTALVGSHDEVAELIADYHRVGVDELILSGYPHVEEAYWFAEGVMPRLRRLGLLDHPGPSRATGAGVPGKAEEGDGTESRRPTTTPSRRPARVAQQVPG